MSWFLNNFTIYKFFKTTVYSSERTKNFLSYLDDPKLPTTNSKLEKAAKLH